ncbi:unnamed protein product [Urochloa humidicola]
MAQLCPRDLYGILDRVTVKLKVWSTSGLLCRHHSSLSAHSKLCIQGNIITGNDLDSKVNSFDLDLVSSRNSHHQ